MKAYKILISLLLLGCLFSSATLSPIKGKTDDLISRPSGLFRTKTAVRVFSTQRPSYNSGIFVDPNSSVAHFGTRPVQPSEDTSVALDQITQQEKSQIGPQVVQQDFEQDTGSVDEKALQNDHQSFQLPGTRPTETSRFDESLAKVSSTSNFGLRIQKNDEESKPSRCYIKGTCSTVSFTPQDKIPSNSRDVTADTNNFDVLNAKVTTEQPEDEDEDGATEEPQETEDVDQDSEIDNDEQISQSNLLGQDSSQGRFPLTQDQVQPFQDGQHKFPEEAFSQKEFSNEGYQGIVSEQSEGIIPADYNSQTQYENSKETTGYSAEHHIDGGFVPPQNQNTYDGINEQKNSLSVDFPAKQTLEIIPRNQENHQTYGNTQFSEYSGVQDVSAGFITPKDNSQNFEVQQQELGGSSHSHVKDGSYQDHDDGQYYHYANPIEGLRYSVPGNPGEDYPIFYQVPETSFNCKQQPFSAGIFGDTEASCQVFHVCKENGGQDSFLCPNGTVFNQQYFVCDWWYNFRCSDTPSLYNLNSHLYWDWESFTPSQMMNVPSNNNEGASNYQGGSSNYHGGDSPNYQDGAPGSFSSILNHDDSRSPALGIAPGQNEATKSTIAIDNTAIHDRNRNNFGQTLHDDVFIQEIAAPPNAFQDNNQGFSEQQNPGYPSSFEFDSPNTIGHQPASVSSGSSFENAPESSHFPTNEQNANNYQPVSSDTGANRQPDSDAGTRYPDQSGYRPQFTDNFQPQGQNVHSTNILENHGSDDYGADIHTRGRPDTQNLVPVPFGDENKSNSFTESYEAVQDNENDYVRNNEQSVSFVTGQQTSFGRNSGGNRDNVNQVQEHINAFDENSAGSFGFDENLGNQNLRGNVDRQDQNTQANQDQTDFPASQFENRQISPETRDNSYVPQNHIIDVNSQEPSFDANKQTILKDESNFNGVNQQDISNSFTGTTRDISDGHRSHNTENNRVVSDGEDISNTAINNQNTAGSTDDIHSQKDEQEHLSIFEDSRPHSFQNNKDDSFEFQNQNAFTQQPADTSFKTNVDENFGIRGSDVNSGNVQGHPQIQQEFVSTSFDDQSAPGTIENDGSFQPGRAFVTNQNDENNHNLQQSHISSSHTGNEASSINRQNTGNRDSNAGFVNIQEGGAPSFQTKDQTSTSNDGSGGNVNLKVDQKVQQEFISSFDENRQDQFDSNGGHDVGQRNPIDQSQETSQIQRNRQNTFQRGDTRDNRNPNNNQEIQQDRIFDPLNKFSPSTTSSNDRDSFSSQDFRDNPNNSEQLSNTDTNANQLLQQQRIASVFEAKKANNIEQSKQDDDFNRGHQRNDETNNRQVPHGQNFKQDNIFISPDGSIQDDFNSRNKENSNVFIPKQDLRIATFPRNEPNFENRNRDQNLGIQNEQLPLRLHQTGISFPFDETLQNDRRNNVNSQGNVQDGFINNRNQVGTVQNSQNNFGSDRQVDNQRTSVSSGVQEHIPVTFDDSRPNSFDSGNDQSRFPQDGFISIQDQRVSFPKNQQNNFGIESNINQENYQRSRENFNQEHVPVSFSGNHPDRINVQNNFNQGENRGDEQSHQQTQSVSFDNRQNFFANRNNGEYQNADVVFERRLNNFQPTNIHTMSRRGHQDINYQQQRMSFRPYGQNQQNKGSNTHVQRLQSVLNQNQGTAYAYSNDNSASNRNFFVTNGHQIRDEQPLQIIQNPFSDRQPTNGNQGQAGQYFSHNSQGHGQLNSNPEITNSRHEQRGDVGAVAVPVGQENSDSRGNNYDSSSNYRNDKSIDSPLNAEVDARGSPTLFINASDAAAYTQPASAVAQVNYNGWKPIIKY